MDLLTAKKLLHPDTSECTLMEIREKKLSVMDEIDKALKLACDCIDKVMMWNERMTDDGK